MYITRFVRQTKAVSNQLKELRRVCHASAPASQQTLGLDKDRTDIEIEDILPSRRGSRGVLQGRRGRHHASCLLIGGKRACCVPSRPTPGSALLPSCLYLGREERGLGQVTAMFLSLPLSNSAAAQFFLPWRSDLENVYDHFISPRGLMTTQGAQYRGASERESESKRERSRSGSFAKWLPVDT